MTRPLTILLTGFTSRQANTAGKKQDDYIIAGKIFADMLTRLGHTVDWRPVQFGEAGIEKYDLVMVGCSDPNSYTGMVHRYGAIWAMLNASRLLIWFDDWRIKGEFHSYVQKPEVYWATRMLHEKRLPEHAEALVYQQQINDMFVGFRDEHRPAVVAQLFNWGDETKFLKEVPEAKWLARFDVSSFAPHYTLASKPIAERRKAWVSASLSQTDDYIEKLKPTWEVIKQCKPKGLAFGGWKKMLEADVVTQLYDTCIGVICKPYSHAGSGWWRVRYNYAMQCNNIVLADPKEVGALGPAFMEPVSAIELLDDAQLQQLADWQREHFLGWQDSQQQALDKLQLHLIRLMDEPTRPRYL